MSFTFKIIEDNLPEEMVQYIADIKKMMNMNVLCEEIKKEDKSCFDTASNKLLTMIAGTGTFQEDHFDTSRKRHKITTVRRGQSWSPLDLSVKIISYRKTMERHIVVYQTKDEDDFDFIVKTKMNFHPCVINSVMSK